LRYTHESVCPGRIPDPKPVRRREPKVVVVTRNPSPPKAQLPPKQPKQQQQPQPSLTSQPAYLNIRELRLKRLEQQKEKYRALFQHAV
jgi:hypothetical protein